MFQSTIIVDPKSEIKGKHDINTYIVQPTVLDRRESIRIKDVQDMLSWCSKTAFAGTSKYVVIEQLHKASEAVPHALLKLLEEPPANTQIIMTIDRAESALNTIRSRCAIVFASDLDLDQLVQLQLTRVDPSLVSATLSWHEFIAKTSSDQVMWLADFIKSKKDSQALLLAWKLGLAESIRHGAPTNQAKAIQQLAILEEVSEALHHNVLPRLALHYLQIRLQRL